MCNMLARALAERPEISTKFAVSFFHMDAKEVLEQANASAKLHRTVQTLSANTKYGGIWRYTLKLEQASLDNYACSFNE